LFIFILFFIASIFLEGALVGIIFFAIFSLGEIDNSFHNISLIILFFLVKYYFLALALLAFLAQSCLLYFLVTTAVLLELLFCGFQSL
jgi:hypothetical protein